MAAYCDKECMLRHWKKGHKAECRPPGEFKSGDLVMVNISRPEGVSSSGPVNVYVGRLMDKTVVTFYEDEAEDGDEGEGSEEGGSSSSDRKSAEMERGLSNLNVAGVGGTSSSADDVAGDGRQTFDTWSLNMGNGSMVEGMPANCLKRLPPSVPPTPPRAA